MSAPLFTPSEQAVMHLVQRLVEDPRLAYLIGPGSESFELLVSAAQLLVGDPVYRDMYREGLLCKLRPQPVPGIGKAGAVIDPELLARIAVYDDQVHDLDSQDDLNMLVNHFVGRGLTVAEAERDTMTEELF